MAFLPDDPTGGSPAFGMRSDFPGAPPIASDAAAEATEHDPQQLADAEFDDARRNLVAKIRMNELDDELKGASSLDDLSERTRRFDQSLAADAATLFQDSRERERWVEARHLEAQNRIDAATVQLTLQQRTADADTWVAQLGQTALRAGGQDAADLIDAGMTFIHRAQSAGVYDEAAARARQQSWLQTHVEARIKQMPPAERLAALGEVPSEDDTAQVQGGRGQSDHLTSVLAPDTRARLQHEARTELERVNTEQAFARNRHYEDGFERALNDGAPLPSADDIAFDPALDAPSRALLERRRETTVRELENYAWFKAKFDESGAGSFDLDDPDTGKFIDRLYKARGADEAALYAVVNRTGVVPGSAYAWMQGGLASDDPVRVGRTLEQLASLAETHPDVQLQQNDGDSLQYALTQFRHATAQGDSPEQAIRRIIASRSLGTSDRPPNQIGNLTEVAKATSPSDLKHLIGTNPIISAALLSVYPELIKDRLAETRDVSLAKAQALDQANRLVEFANSADDRNAPEGSSKESGAEPISLAERERLHERMAYFDTFIGTLKFARLMEVKASIDAGLNGDQLIAKHAPGLNSRGQEARRQAELEYFKKIPELYAAAIADRAKYDAMPAASSAEEMAAAASGYAKGSVWGVEKLFGPSRVARVLMTSALRAKLPTSGAPSASGPGFPQTAGWWQTALPAQELNNEALGLGMIAAGAPPLQPRQGAATDQGRRPFPPAAQPGRPAGGIDLPPPVPVPLNPPSPVSVPRTDTSAQSKADEKEEEEEEKWGVYFFGDDVVGFIDRPDATLGVPGKWLFFMPLEDSHVVVDAATAYQHTGAAPSVKLAYESGAPIYGVKFPLKGRTFRQPTRADTDSEHFVEGGHTAIRNPDGTYTINETREFVTPGGDRMPKGAVLFVLSPGGVRISKRTW